MSKFIIYFVSVIAIALGVSNALTEEETTALNTAVAPILESCGKEFGVTNEQVLAAKETGNLDTIDACYFACFFKTAGIVDEKGFFDANVTLEKNKKYIKSEDSLTRIEAIGKACISVNEQAVTDGDKACERSKLLMSCFITEKANLTPFLSA